MRIQFICYPIFTYKQHIYTRTKYTYFYNLHFTFKKIQNALISEFMARSIVICPGLLLVITYPRSRILLVRGWQQQQQQRLRVTVNHQCHNRDRKYYYYNLERDIV